MNRRRFLQAGAARIGAGALGLSAAAGAAAGMAPLERLLGQQPGQEPLAGQGANGSLRDPDAAGRPLSATTAADNDEAIKQIEQHLHCTCGCNLDIYTCRTTDFSCSYSPELHKEVVALYDSGKTAQQIVDAFVAKYGEKVLMAPPAEGFNLAGYLVPGALI
ncbi:MAG TPA: cytochrome c-type biogenesis protein CcmH, partial [Gemmatimonadales bacterium]|nr:cytochrome c-type biogenesis protein CcmH [Gemmatimonadales bacterium]